MTEPSLQDKIETILEEYYPGMILTSPLAAKAILALVEEIPKDKDTLSVQDLYLFEAGVAHGKVLVETTDDVCDKHKKEDCMECFYTTQPIDPTSPSSNKLLTDEELSSALDELVKETSTPPPTETIDTFVRDICSIVPKSKSEVRRRLELLIAQALSEERARVVEEVEGMKVKTSEYDGDIAWAQKRTRNQVCDSIIKALSK